MLAWMCVVAVWSIGVLIPSSLSRTDFGFWAAVVSGSVLVIDVLAFMVWLTVWFLQLQQAWPFVPS